jgi:PAS domain S-box-containing protein
MSIESPLMELENSLQGTAIIQDGKYIYVNLIFAETLGYSPAELQNLEPQEVWNLIHPEDRKGLMERDDILESGTLVLPRHTFRYIARDGSVKFVDSFARRISYKGRPATQVYEIDITELKEAQQALRENEERYRTIVQSMTDIIIVYDESDRYSQCYASDENLLLTRPEEFLGKPLVDVLPEDVSELHLNAMKEVRESGIGKNIDYPLVINDEEFWFSASLSLHEDKRSVVSVIRNITEKRTTQDALQQNEERYRLLFEAVPIAITITDDEGNFIAANQAMQEMTGYSWEELRFLNATTQYAHPPDRDLLVQTVHKEGRLRNIETRLRRKNGSVYTALLNEDLMKLGNRDLILATIRDISALKDAEIALRESEEKYRVLAEESLQGLAIMQGENIIFANQAYANLTGFSVDELYKFSAREIWQLIHPDDRTRLRERSQAHEDDLSYRGGTEYRIVRKDGQIRWVEAFVSVIEVGGEPAMQSAFIDITWRKEAEIAAREEKEKAELYLQMAGVMFIALDMKGIITLINRRGCEILKGEPQDIIGEDWSQFVPDRFQKDMQDVFRKLIKDEIEQVDYYERPVLSLTGEERVIAWHITSLSDDNGVITGIIGSGEDITDKLRTQREVVTARDRAMLYLDLLSHDIANQMQVVLGGTQLARSSEHPEVEQKALRMVEEAAERCNDIITKVKSTARLSAVPLIQRSLAEAVNNVSAEFQKKFPDVEIDFDIIESESSIMADDFLEILLASVIENAAIHNQRTQRKVWIRVSQMNDGFEVSIADNGEGVSDENKTWLLDMERRSGGIELHQARQIVDKYSGHITIHDRVRGLPTKGADFRIWIPKTNGVE